MRAPEIRELSDQELLQEEEDSYRERFNLRLRLATKQLTNTSQLRASKRNTARLKTIARERQLGVK